jgi:octaprenyl-diphosphate synthase
MALPGLARALISAGKLGQKSAEDLSRKAASSRTSFIAELTGSGAVSPSDLAHTMSIAFGAPLLDLNAVDVKRLPKGLLDAKTCQDYRVVVLSKRNNRLIVATADPSDQQAAEKIKFATQMGVDWVIAEGEVLQLMNMHDASLDEAAYLRVIRSKTAKLFEASARLGAVLAGAAPELEEACATYGQALGTAFQVIDDVLDYDGDAVEMGKNLGDDLREGKATLPLIAAMQRGSPEQRETIRHAIESGGAAELDRIVAIVKETGALEVTREAAAGEARRAVDAAGRLPRNEYSQGLLQLAAQLLARRH